MSETFHAARTWDLAARHRIVSRTSRRGLLVSGPAQLENAETFVLSSAAISPNVEMTVTPSFPADPCRGCISHVKVSLCFTMKVQHCKSHGALIKCGLRKKRLHQCEVTSFRSCGCFPRMRSIWFRERGQDLWTMCNIKSPGLRRPSSSRRPASRCRGTWQPPAGAQRHLDPAQVALSVNQNWQQVETAASWKSCSLTGLRRPFRGVRGSWSFRLYGGLPRGVAVLCDRWPVLSCICTPV